MSPLAQVAFAAQRGSGAGQRAPQAPEPGCGAEPHLHFEEGI